MEEKRPKVLALYQAVLELLDEGADVNTMKVSDITERAGIGKGPAYDYFKSREEIIACAILYDMQKKVKKEAEQLKQFVDFDQKIRYIFDWVMHHFQEQKAFSRFLRLSSQPGGIKGVLLEKIKNSPREGLDPITILRELCREGIEQGKIRGDLTPNSAAVMVFANLASFVMYLENLKQLSPEEYEEEPETEWMKNFLSESLLKQLR